MDGLESQVVITSIQKAVTVAGSLCSTSERAVLHLLDMHGQFDKTWEPYKEGSKDWNLETL